MTTPTFSDTIITNLPSPLPSGGLFDVTEVVGPSGFAPTSPSTTFSYPLMNPANLVGVGSQPYMPVALPAYITTLYQNVYGINTNLKSDISSIALNNRDYPTSYAVQKYVQDQISGHQVIDGTTLGTDTNTYVVSTSKNNTLVRTVPGVASKYNFTDNFGNNAQIAMFWMDTTVNAVRNGATKTVMYADNAYRIANGANNLAFLYAGDGSYFVHMGTAYRFYQFVYVGDFVSFVQAYDTTANNGAGGWKWLVTNSMGLFLSSIDTSGSTPSVNSGNNTPTPTPSPFTPTPL